MPNCSFGIIANGNMLIHEESITEFPFYPKPISIPTRIISYSHITYFIKSDQQMLLTIKKRMYDMPIKIHDEITYDKVYLTDNIFVSDGLLLTKNKL